MGVSEKVNNLERATFSAHFDRSHAEVLFWKRALRDDEESASVLKM
jgi:hypothetical protein